MITHRLFSLVPHQGINFITLTARRALLGGCTVSAWVREAGSKGIDPAVIHVAVVCQNCSQNPASAA